MSPNPEPDGPSGPTTMDESFERAFAYQGENRLRHRRHEASSGIHPTQSPSYTRRSPHVEYIDMGAYEIVPLSALRRDHLYDDEEFTEEAIRRLEAGYSNGVVAIRVWRDYVVTGGRLYEFLKRSGYSEIRVLRVPHPLIGRLTTPENSVNEMMVPPSSLRYIQRHQSEPGHHRRQYMINHYDSTPGVIQVWKDFVVQGQATLQVLMERGDTLVRVYVRTNLPITEYPGDLDNGT